MKNINKQVREIQVSGLVKKYSHIIALDNINLEVFKGDIFGLLGPNGAGKTTLIRILAGLILPTKGATWLSGINTSKDSKLALMKTGFVMDTPAAYPHLSGRQNLEAISRMLRGKQQLTVEEVLSRVGLNEHADRPVNSYSLGMKKRLDIGGILLGDPEILILDEPTSGLDPNGINQIHQLLVGLTKNGKTVLFSSHQLHDVEQLCNRIAILNKGKIVATGFLQDLLKSWSKTVRMRFIMVEKAESILSTIPDSPLIERSNDIFLIDRSKHSLSNILGYLEKHDLQPIDVFLGESLEEFFLKLTEGQNE